MKLSFHKKIQIKKNSNFENKTSNFEKKRIKIDFFLISDYAKNENPRLIY